MLSQFIASAEKRHHWRQIYFVRSAKRYHLNNENTSNEWAFSDSSSGAFACDRVIRSVIRWLSHGSRKPSKHFDPIDHPRVLLAKLAAPPVGNEQPHIFLPRGPSWTQMFLGRGHSRVSFIYFVSRRTLTAAHMCRPSVQLLSGPSQLPIFKHLSAKDCFFEYRSVKVK